MEKIDAEIFGEFTIIATLGKGGHSTVYLCKEPDAGKMYALKVLDKTRSGSDLWKQERDTLESLPKHKCIPALYGYGKNELGFVLVLDYIDGMTLDKYLEKYGPMIEIETFFVIKRLLEALIFLQINKRAHRDIKLENIMIENKNPARLKLIDFGLSTKLIGKNPEFCTDSQYIGTPIYMAPEVLVKDNHSFFVDKTEVWSVGICLWTLLIGRHPFRSMKSNSQLLRTIKEGLEPKVPTDSKIFLSHCLDVSPFTRDSLRSAKKRLIGILRRRKLNKSM